MKVVCVDLRENKQITIGKVYDVVSSGSKLFYVVINDGGAICSYESLCFKEISVIREEKLIELGI